MSIYASWRVLDCEHEDHCGIWVPIGDDPACVEEGDPRDCTCGLPFAPLVYGGSHVLPSDADHVGGYIEIASIPDHIEREDRPEVPDGTPKPWLRFDAGGDGGQATLVLTRKHVERLRDVLTEWLERRPEDESELSSAERSG